MTLQIVIYDDLFYTAPVLPQHVVAAMQRGVAVRDPCYCIVATSSRVLLYSRYDSRTGTSELWPGVELGSRALVGLRGFYFTKAAATSTLMECGYTPSKFHLQSELALRYCRLTFIPTLDTPPAILSYHVDMNTPIWW